MIQESSIGSATKVKRVVIVGVSHRSIVLCREIPKDVREGVEIVGLWDVDPLRFEAFTDAFPELEQQPAHYVGEDSFPRMMAEVKPDLAFVVTMDRYHADYIIACLKHDVDVLVEKPMVINCEQAQAVLAAERASKASVTVGFNYRYSGVNQAIKRTMVKERMGRITTGEVCINVGILHGSSFFQRWNRLRANSGGLSIHKEGHYIDLITWWLNQKPVEVFCYGGLHYFGPDGDFNPSRKDGRHCRTCEEIEQCEYAQARLRSDEKAAAAAEREGVKLFKRHLSTNAYSGYSPDMCIYDSEIDIEDTYSAVILFDGGTSVTFSVNFSSAGRGNRIVFNGTRGRMEYGYPFSGDIPQTGSSAIIYTPLFRGQAEKIQVEKRPGGHGGGDPAMLEDLFSGVPGSPNRATAQNGSYVVAVGEAMWRSIQTRQPVRIADLLGQYY